MIEKSQLVKLYNAGWLWCNEYMSPAFEYRPLAEDMPWEGAVNARRIIGGCFRMGRREWLTERGWQQVRASGIARVIDLRNPDEIRTRDTDPQISAAALEGLELRNFPLERPGNARYERLAVPYMNHPALYRVVCEEFAEQLRELFRYLAADPRPTLLHCSAGRDRSGLIATLLLALAGRPELAYEHDQWAVRGINEWHRVAPRPHPYERYQGEAELSAKIRERATALADFLSWLGPADEYVASLGLDATELSALRALLDVQNAADAAL